MIDLGNPLHSADTCFVRGKAADIFQVVVDPGAYPVWWAALRVSEQEVSAVPSIGDNWRARALEGARGLDCRFEVMDFRSDLQRNIWMDVRGVVDPCVGIGCRQQPFEAETEWYLRPWGEEDGPGTEKGTLVSVFWRVRSDPRRRQERLLRMLRRVTWRGLNGLKILFENDVS